jgi:universal stress protein E
MKLLKKILVPVDFEQASVRVVETAVQFSKFFMSEITLLHVFPKDKVSEETEKIIHEGVKIKMNALLQKFENGNSGQNEYCIEKGLVYEQIIELAESKNFDLIIVGAGNHKGNDPFALGSNTEKLMQNNQIPVFVVKNEAFKPIKKILCPVDFSESSKRALTNAIFLSNRLGAKLTIFNVYSPLQILTYRIEIDIKKENEEYRNQQWEEFNIFLNNFHLSHDYHKIKMVDGIPETEIINEIKNENIDLLIMGTAGKKGLSRIFLGSVTEKVTRELPVNFIITSESEISEKVFEDNLKIIESLVISAKNFFKNNEIEKSIDKYTQALKQYPDNIPALMGLVRCYNKTGNNKKAEFYYNYTQKLIKRVWGKEHISILDNFSDLYND